MGEETACVERLEHAIGVQKTPFHIVRSLRKGWLGGVGCLLSRMCAVWSVTHQEFMYGKKDATTCTQPGLLDRSFCVGVGAGRSLFACSKLGSLLFSLEGGAGTGLRGTLVFPSGWYSL